MWRLMLILNIVLIVLAGCGGANVPTDTQEVVAPTATPFPTLVFEERIQYTAGFIENPFRIAIRPNMTVQTRILDLLGAQNVSMPINLDADTTTIVQEAILTDFDVVFSPSDWDSLTTIGDMIALVQRRVADQWVREIYDRTSLYFEVIFVDSYGQALRALCDSERGVVTIPILDGMTALVALANDCGEPALQIAMSPDMPSLFAPLPVVERIAEATPTPELTPDVVIEATEEIASEPTEAVIEVTEEAIAEPTEEIVIEATEEIASEETPEVILEITPEPVIVLDLQNVVTGTRGVFFVSRTFGAQSVSVMQNRTLCRLNIRDFYSWFLPDLILDTARIIPIAVIEKPTPRDIFDAVANNECAGAMLSQDDLNVLGGTTGVDVVQRTVQFPYGVIFYPLEVELGIKLRLNEVLPEIASEWEGGQAMRLLLGQVTLLPATADDLRDLQTFIATTDYDLSQLGR